MNVEVIPSMGLVKGKTEITWCASMNESANMKSAKI